MKAVVGELLGEARFADGRAHERRIRVRLYDSSQPNDSLVDTDPDLSPELPGTGCERTARRCEADC
jgi:hypothetical protein